MKKIIIQLTILFLTITVYSQEKGLDISVMGGISQPMGSYKTETVPDVTEDRIGAVYDFIGYDKTRKGNMFYNLDVNYRFGKFGMGLSLGNFSHEISEYSYHTPFKTSFEGGNLSGTYYGIGPNYNMSFSKLNFAMMLRAGMANYKYDGFKGFYAEDDVTAPVNILESEMKIDAKTSMTYSSIGIKLSYPISKNLSVFTKFDYLMTLGKGLEVEDTYYLPVDMNQNDTISAFDVAHFTIEEFKREQNRFIKPTMLHVGVGLTYNIPFGKSKRPAKSIKTSMVKSPLKDNKKDDEQKIVLTSPENNAHFENQDEIKRFSWKVVGKPFNNPKYFIEVRPLNKTGRTYFATTEKMQISPKAIFGDAKPTDQFVWRVTEQHSGTGSNPRSLFFDQCEFDFNIDNVSIECKGYEGNKRKYKICFDATYSGSTGDLTYANTGSGLSVYDQNYTALTYTLTGTNTTLQTQIGSTASTVNYCFETLVDNTVTAIGFGLQGDDLDPSPAITCQPGASNGIDDLPDCLCDECDRIEISTGDFNIQADNQNPGIFTFDGNINVNVPVYGIEMQIVSMNYNSNPDTCSQGVTSVETSGIFLHAGTTINNSGSIIFFNESASQSPNSNTNASKDIKYISNSALNGNIPVHLNIGLPQALNGLSPDCCQIDYTVCLKISVFYEDGTCKTCDITKCFNFNNQ